MYPIMRHYLSASLTAAKVWGCSSVGIMCFDNGVPVLSAGHVLLTLVSSNHGQKGLRRDSEVAQAGV